MTAAARSLFFLVFLAHAYFVGALGWNQSARLGAILAFVEPGPSRFTLRIDEFVRGGHDRNLNTGDWALGADGHYYANKAPGASMIGVPAYAALYAIERGLGVDPLSQRVTRLNTLLLNLWCSVAWTAAASAVLFAFLAAAGWRRLDAVLGALAYAFATLVFPYDTSVWGHTTAAACLLVSLCLVAWPGAPKLPALAGAAGGLAVLVEYPAALALPVFAAALLARPRALRNAVAYGSGAALPILALLVYHQLAFGDPFATAVSRGNPIFLEQDRVFGVLGGVRPEALWGLLFSAWRGLFLHCPVLLFALAGGVQQWRQGRRALVAAAAASFLAVLLFVASFNAWWGGAATGARYLIVAIPMLAVLAPRLDALPAWLRPVHLGALALSCLNMLAATAVEPMVSEAERNPIYGLAWPLLLHGAYPLEADTWNLGMLLGLPPRADLLPFLLGFGAWALALVRSARAAGART